MQELRFVKLLLKIRYEFVLEMKAGFDSVKLLVLVFLFQ